MSNIPTLRTVAFKMQRQKYSDGRLKLGVVDFEYGGLRLCGCELVTARLGGLTILPPVPGGKPHAVRKVEFRTSELRREMVRLALANYIAFGGTEFNQDEDRIEGLEHGNG